MANLFVFKVIKVLIYFVKAIESINFDYFFKTTRLFPFKTKDSINLNSDFLRLGNYYFYYCLAQIKKKYFIEEHYFQLTI